MSSPPDSLTDIEESALNKKRGRAQSVEPTPAQDIDDALTSSQETSAAIVSAPKKTKRDDDDKATVNTIRKNMKDMSTTDKNLTAGSASTQTTGSQEDDEDDEEEQDDEPMGTIAEEETGDDVAEKTTSANPFGGNNKDDDDWGEFAEEEDEEDTKPVAAKEIEEKPKYTFGASSGFGTKGWAASHQSIPTPSKQSTFGSFASSSGFGGFKSAAPVTTTSTTSDTSSPFKSAATTSVPSFGSFAKTNTSPFAVAAAAGNALLSASPNNNSNNNSSNSPAVSSASTDNNDKDTSDEESDSDDNNTATTAPAAAFGQGAKVKVPGIKQQTEVKTGEEDEDTIYQTKGKLLVLDSSSNWKERGVGTFRINVKDEQDKPAQTRLVMRTDSVYRVILNLLLFEGMKVFIMQDKFVRFGGFEAEQKEDGTVETKLVSFALKLSNSATARELCDQINRCIPSSKA